MTTNKIVRNIVPNTDSEGALISVSFIVNVQIDTFMEEMSWQTPLPMVAPAEGEPPHSAATLTAKCTELATSAGIFADLERKVLARKNRAPATAVPIPEISDDDKRARWFNQVDDTIAAILTKYTRFERGYIEREAAAKAFFDSGYSIAPTTWITRFADNVGMDYPAAARLILAQAAQLRPAIQALENLRMDKYLVQRAPTIAEAQNEMVRIIGEANAIAASLK
jgi:hypothetical protein